MKTCFIVPGKPQGKGRPRVTVRGGYGHAYTPKRTREYEEAVRQEFFLAGGILLEGPVRATVIAFYPIPKHAHGDKRADMEAGKILPERKPDLDNIVKTILDALNGTAFRDDSSVVEIWSWKRYTASEGYVKVMLEEMPDRPRGEELPCAK